MNAYQSFSKFTLFVFVFLFFGILPRNINGELVGYIGSRNGQNHFAGVVDEVAFWNEAIPVEASMNPQPVKGRDKLATTWATLKRNGYSD